MKKLIMLAMVVGLVFISSVAISVNYGPFDKIKALAMVNGKCVSGDMCVLQVQNQNQDARFTLIYDEKSHRIMITKQIRSNPDEKYFTGKRVSLICDTVKNLYGIKVDELGTGGGKWVEIDWNAAWDIAYVWVREVNNSLVIF